MFIEHFFNLGRVDILSRAYYHVVLPAVYCNVQVLIPVSQISGVHPALVILLLFLFRVVIIAVCRLSRCADNDFTNSFIICSNKIIRFSLAVIVNLDNPYLIVDAASSYCSCIVRQVVRSQERVPESFCCSVPVEDIRCQHLQESSACSLFKRRTHGNESLQLGKIERCLFLYTCQHLQGSRGSCQECDPVLFQIMQCCSR